MKRRKSLIVSPQAGMCNRFRAICSTILLGELTGRRVYHNWAREEPLPTDIKMIREMRAVSLNDFFEENGAIPYIHIDRDSRIDEVYSEWAENERWYAAQSSAIKRCTLPGPVHVERSNADAIIMKKADNFR